MTQPMDLYFFPTPNGWKVSVALEEMNLPYRVHRVNILQGEQFAADYTEISPNQKIPALVDPDGPGGQPIQLFESGAILMYLGRKTGQFYPTTPREQLLVEQWLMWQMGGLGPMLGQNHHFAHFAPLKLPYAQDRYIKETRRLYGVMDRQLATQDYLAGQYSIADMACVGWVSVWERQGLRLTDFPNVERWLARLMSRPGVQRGLALGRG